MFYCRNLGFTEDPDYQYLRRLFKELYAKCGFENEFIFDWTIQRYNTQFNQASFGAALGLKIPKAGGSSGNDNSEKNPSGGSAEEEKISMENQNHLSNDDENMEPENRKSGNLSPTSQHQRERDQMQLNQMVENQFDQQEQEII